MSSLPAILPTQPLRFLSLFSGIEAASMAWLALGMECVAVAEVDKFASAVLKHHHPNVPNLGDVRTITEAQIQALGHIDIVVFGFPCQDLSVAGKRAGLHNNSGEVTRSGLFFTAMQIVRWSRARWAVAENVPGLFSSKQGADFAAVAGEMAGCDPDTPKKGWKNSGFLIGRDALCEWGVLDAQFFGVPQRRRRVFLIRDTGDWRSRPPVLLEPESLRGNSPPRRETRKGVAGGVEVGPSGGRLTDVAPTMDARAKDGFIRNQLGAGVQYASTDEAREWPTTLAPTLNAHYGDKWGLEDQHALGGAGLFVPGENPNRVGDHAVTCHQAKMGDPTTDNYVVEVEVEVEPQVTHSLRADGFDASEDGTGRGTLLVPIAFDTTQITSQANYSKPKPGDPCHPLAAGAHPPAIAFSSKDHGADVVGITPTYVATLGHTKSNGLGVTETETANTLEAVSSGNQAVCFESRFARNGRGAPSDVVPPLKAQSGETGKGDAALPVAFGFSADQSAGAGTIAWQPEQASTNRGGSSGTNQVPAVAIQNATRGKSQNGLGVSNDGAMYTLDQGSQHGVAVGEPLQYNGIHGRTLETDSVEILQILRQEAGEATFTEWGIGMLDLIRQKEVLQPEMLRSSEWPTLAKEECKVERVPSQGAEDLSQGSMFEVWSSKCFGRSPQKQGLAGQQSRQFRAYLSLLSHDGAQRGQALRYLWIASEGIGVLREALSEVQKAWRSACGENTATEDVSSMRYSGTQQRTMREALHAMEARETSRVNGGAGVMAVRRLTPE